MEEKLPEKVQGNTASIFKKLILFLGLKYCL